MYPYVPIDRLINWYIIFFAIISVCRMNKTCTGLFLLKGGVDSCSHLFTIWLMTKFNS
jgi:hypothetical protein